MLNLESGRPLAFIAGGKANGKIIYMNDKMGFDDDNGSEDSSSDDFGDGLRGYEKFELSTGTVQPLLNTEQRTVNFIAGPAGSGKSTYASKLGLCYKAMFPKRKIYFFSRTSVDSDPAYRDLKPIQILLDDDLLENPIDIEKDVEEGSLLIFDDVGSINDKKMKKALSDLIIDICEVGRRMGIWIILTSHLVNPSDRNLSRCIMNEATSFTFFPKSGAVYQIKYALEKYFGLAKKQIKEVMDLPSRWVTVSRTYPQTVLYRKGVFIL